jgi:hypothetical protein
MGVEVVVLSNTVVCNFIKKVALDFACKNAWKLEFVRNVKERPLERRRYL